MKLSDIPESPPRILLYGDVGTGKTALATTLGARCQVLDLDDGLKTCRTLDDKWKPNRTAIDVKRFQDEDPARAATVFNAVKSFIYALPGEIKAKKYPYDALVIDSLTAFADAAVRQIMGNSGKLGTNPEIQHWGLAFTEIKNVLGVLRSLPIVVVLIAHEQTKTIDEVNKLEIAVSGKNLPNQICRYFDEIWYMRAKQAGQGKIAYTIRTKATATILARSRCNIPDDTDTSCGLWELIKKCGYTPPERKSS